MIEVKIKAKLRGVGYIRISDNKQVGNHSVDIQKRMIFERAKQEGIEIIHWREDQAESAYRKRASKRKMMVELLHDAKKVDAIIFYDESRLTRKIYDFHEEIYRPIKDRYPNIKFFSAQSPGEWDPNNPLVQSKLLYAAEESFIKSTRARDAQISMISNKERPGARAPVGYDLVDGVLVPNEDAPIIVRIFDHASWGYSNANIAERLNVDKVNTKHVNRWHSSTMPYILSNSAYAGELRWNIQLANLIEGANDGKELKLFQDLHEPIISPAKFVAVNQVKQLKMEYGKLDTPFLLRNLIHCSQCNTTLKAKDNSPKSKSKQYLVYRCPSCKCNIRIQDVHDEVVTDLIKKLTSNLFQMVEESKVTMSQWLRTLQSLKESVEQTEERISYNERLLEQRDDPENMIHTIKHSKMIMKEKKLKLTQAIGKIQSLNNDQALYEVYTHFKQADVSSLSNTELRTLCLTFIEQIKLTTKNHNKFSVTINYRLNPFVELENATDQITENLLRRLPAKPKGIKQK